MTHQAVFLRNFTVSLPLPQVYLVQTVAVSGHQFVADGTEHQVADLGTSVDAVLHFESVQVEDSQLSVSCPSA